MVLIPIILDQWKLFMCKAAKLVNVLPLSKSVDFIFVEFESMDRLQNNVGYQSIEMGAEIRILDWAT